MKLKKMCAALLGAVIGLGCVSAVAENADDYEFWKDEPVDFCIFNMWAQSFVEAPKGDIESIKMVVEVTDYDADVDILNTKLYSRESVTWETHCSEIVPIDGDGTYTYYLKFDEPFPSENLCTIYVKDVIVALPDEDPDGQGKEITASGVFMNMKLVSCDFNVPDPSAEPDAPEVIETPTAAPVETEAPTQAATEAPTEAVTQAASESTAPAATQAAQQTEQKEEKNNGVKIGIIIAIVVAAIAFIAVVGVFIRKKL